MGALSRPGRRRHESAARAAAAAESDLLAEWEARNAARREADARGEPLASNVTHCIPDGVPSMMNGPFPFEIVQNATQINIAQEAYSQIRRIYLDKPQLTLDDIELGFYGRSVGKWQGDTLVVDTIGIKEYVRFRDVPHTRDMRITERFRLVTPDILWDEITIEDPACSRSLDGHVRVPAHAGLRDHRVRLRGQPRVRRRGRCYEATDWPMN